MTELEQLEDVTGQRNDKSEGGQLEDKDSNSADNIPDQNGIH